MSSKKKTGDKLVASIRKSKTGAVASKTTQRPDANKTAAKPKSTAARPAPKATPAEDSRRHFSHARRVWPD